MHPSKSTRCSYGLLSSSLTPQLTVKPRRRLFSSYADAWLIALLVHLQQRPAAAKGWWAHGVT